jgi:membrane peptidoglycan carboxypeptidase
MPIVSQTIKFRYRRNLRDSHSPWGKLGLISGVLISLVTVIFTLVGINYYFSLTSNLPPPDIIPALIQPPHGALLQPTRLYDRTHQHIILSLENPAAVNKQYMWLTLKDGKISSQALTYLADATLASYDPGFWHEPGYSLSGLSKGTHPTLAQLLVNNLVFDNEEPSLKRNLRERLLAAQLTAHYGREKVLEWYLNSARYGKFIYGADAAARVYFGKPAERLSLGEAAMLVAIQHVPSADVWTELPALKELQAQVLVKMFEQGFINYDEERQALKEFIQFQPQIAALSISPAFTNLVLQQLSQVISLDQVYRGGFEIVTSLDYELQKQVDCASQVQLARLHGIAEQGLPEEKEPCEAASYLTGLSVDETPPVEDLFSNIVILEPASGRILAMVGDGTPEIEPAFPNRHPVGTIVSPLLYLTAFTRGMSPATLLWDIPANDDASDSSQVVSEASQSSLAAYHGPVSLRQAFANDYIGAAANVYQQIGAENVWLTENRFGISTVETPPVSHITIDGLYAQQATLLEIVQAYGVLANQGFMAGQPDPGSAQVHAEPGLNPTSILSVSGVDGEVWLDWTVPQSLAVVSTQLAYLTTDVLSDLDVRQSNVEQSNPLDIGRPIAVKSGTSVDNSSVWTIGYTPQLVVGVWMGQTQPVTINYGSELAGDLWKTIMKYATNSLEVQNFNTPAGISRTLVCEPSGMLASPICPEVKEELFLEGNEPSQVDDKYQKYWVNRDTGLLATIFTPTNLVDEKVYMVIPPQAMDWAKQAGFPVPPEAYDEAYLPPPSNQDVNFNSPALFNHVGGLVRFYGSARGEDFAYYRLQVGEGLNPQQWTQIGVDVDQPVKDGMLGTWDTTGLHGNYVVELLLVRQDKEFEQAFLQLTVDNELPRVQILAPEENEILKFEQDKSLIIQASAEDDLGLKQVEFYVDNHLIATLYEAPFIVFWPVQLGEHNMQVIAYDYAGNQNDAEVSFSVIQ